MRRTQTGQWIVTTVYLSEEMVTAIEVRREQVEEEQPGMRITTSDVIRNLIQRGLEGSE